VSAVGVSANGRMGDQRRDLSDVAKGGDGAKSEALERFQPSPAVAGCEA
jgi:hypothetical protein